MLYNMKDLLSVARQHQFGRWRVQHRQRGVWPCGG